MLRCGLLGRKLGHSYSPRLHQLLGEYAYALYEREPEKVAAFLREGAFDGLNVTIPYKKTVLPFCAALTRDARETGAVNTLLRREDGTLLGDNTDVAGFARLLKAQGFEPAGQSTLVLGSGGASAAVCAVLRRAGAQVTVISRAGPEDYASLSRHRDASLLVNATPVGMYPQNGIAPLSLDALPKLRRVVDLIYNPARTALLLEAERRGIPGCGGLLMLAAQAAASSRVFTGRTPRRSPEEAAALLERETRNIVLIGMPGAGKSTLARLLGARAGRPVWESDQALTQETGLSIPDFFARFGEEAFRRRETEVLRRLGAQSGTVIATGGGAVLREENYDALRQNGVLVWIRRDIDRLPREGRPLSQGTDLHTLYEARRARYQHFADLSIDNHGTPEAAAERIWEAVR